MQYSNLGTGPVLNSATYSKDDSHPSAVALSSVISLECEGTFSRCHKQQTGNTGLGSFTPTYLPGNHPNFQEVCGCSGTLLLCDPRQSPLPLCACCLVV